MEPNGPRVLPRRRGHAVQDGQWYLFQIGTALETNITAELDKLVLWKQHMHLKQAFSIALHIRTRDSNMDAGSGREGDTANLVDQMEICTSILVKRMGHYK